MLEIDRVRKLIGDNVYMYGSFGASKAVLVCAEPEYLDLAVGLDFSVGYAELVDFNHHFSIMETAALRIQRTPAPSSCSRRCTERFRYRNVESARIRRSGNEKRNGHVPIECTAVSFFHFPGAVRMRSSQTTSTANQPGVAHAAEWSIARIISTSREAARTDLPCHLEERWKRIGSSSSSRYTWGFLPL